MSLWGCPLHPTWEPAPSSGFPPAPPLGRPPPPAHTLTPSSGLLRFIPTLSVAEASFLPWLSAWIVQEGNRRMSFCSQSWPSVPLQIFTNSLKKCIWSHNVWYCLGLVQIKSHHCPVLGTQTLSGKLIYKYSHLKSTELVFFLKNQLINFGLCWVFVTVWGFSLVAVHGGYSLLQCAGLWWWLLSLCSTGSRVCELQ